ncbi:AarF/UbiB family protein [Vibrio sp. HN007]|uniref:AarF/UbiB family protein n=1 Tax=Vibrio iocasae TaxID=3098914 RepID=UPI0035D4BFA3
MNQRQKEQQEFDESGKNLIVGLATACPLKPEELAAITPDSPCVVEVFTSGLTAEVYRLRIKGNDYTLKKKREESKVQNLDGKYSFLNEVQRRSDFQKLKDDATTAGDYQHIVPTIYADYQMGIILSPWLEGELLQKPNQAIVSQLFSTLFACEKAGLFEWDLCSGNMIVDEEQQLWMFDFGYMYPFNPLKELNSNGLSDPIFQFCERFETRFLSGWIAKNELDSDAALKLFRMVKKAALEAISQKLEWLIEQGADDTVVSHYVEMQAEYEKAVSDSDELKRRYMLDMFRSHVLDIEDDLDGKSCTSTTALRVKAVIGMLDKHYDLLREGGGLFYQNSGKKRSELIRQYIEKSELVEEYQV